MIRQFDAFVHLFDKFGEPVANLNMAGKTQFRTRLGGLCGMAVYGLMTWFIFVRMKKMLNRENPTIYEVTQAMDVGAESESYNFKENNFHFGYQVMGEKI